MVIVLALTAVALWLALSLIVVGLCASAARGDREASGSVAGRRFAAVPEWSDLAA